MLVIGARETSLCLCPGSHNVLHYFGKEKMKLVKILLMEKVRMSWNLVFLLHGYHHHAELRGKAATIDSIDLIRYLRGLVWSMPLSSQTVCLFVWQQNLLLIMMMSALLLMRLALMKAQIIGLKKEVDENNSEYVQVRFNLRSIDDN